MAWLVCQKLLQANYFQDPQKLWLDKYVFLGPIEGSTGNSLCSTHVAPLLVVAEELLSSPNVDVCITDNQSQLTYASVSLLVCW